MEASSKKLSNAWRSAWAPKDRRPIHEWAREYVRLAPPITKVGLFDVSDSRHFIGIFESCQNDHKRETNVLKPVRGGGSLIGDVRTPHALVTDPGPYMDIFQTDKVADEHAESRIVPIFEGCPPLAELFPDERHKKRNNEIMFSNGCAWYCCGPSLGNLQTKGIRWMRLEEVWMWDQGRMGDALARLGDYLRQQISHALTISQGGPKEGVEMRDSDWYRHYHRGQLLEWETLCLGCGKPFDPIFSGARADGSFYGLTWNKHMLPNGDWDIAKCVPTVRFECPHCAHPSLDNGRTKSEWNRTGQWSLRSEPNTKRDSFHWEAVIDYPWDELVELWLDACNAEKRGDLGPKRQFYQKRRAKFCDDEMLLKGGFGMRRIAYDVNAKLENEEESYMSIDVQKDHFWWMVRVWSKEKSRRVGFGKVYSYADLEELRIHFKVKEHMVLIDSAHNARAMDGVYAACVHYGWIAVRGDAAFSFAHHTKRGRVFFKCYPQKETRVAPPGVVSPGWKGRTWCFMMRFSKPTLNAKVQELIDNQRWEEPAIVEDLELEKEYNTQMASRYKKTDYDPKLGKHKVWWKEGKNDHARDLANYQVLAAIWYGRLPDPTTERLSDAEKKRIGEDEESGRTYVLKN